MCFTAFQVPPPLTWGQHGQEPRPPHHMMAYSMRSPRGEETRAGSHGSRGKLRQCKEGSLLFCQREKKKGVLSLALRPRIAREGEATCSSPRAMRVKIISHQTEENDQGTQCNLGQHPTLCCPPSSTHSLDGSDSKRAPPPLARTAPCSNNRRCCCRNFWDHVLLCPL